MLCRLGHSSNRLGGSKITPSDYVLLHFFFMLSVAEPFLWQCSSSNLSPSELLKHEQSAQEVLAHISPLKRWTDASARIPFPNPVILENLRFTRVDLFSF